jgi:benzoate 4-monooxygenase
MVMCFQGFRIKENKTVSLIMAILSYVIEHPIQALVAVFLVVAVYHLVAWRLDEHGIRAIPGPMLAAMSDGWLGYWAAQGCRSVHVHEMHKKYGASHNRAVV